MHRFSQIFDANLFEFGMRNSQPLLHFVKTRLYFDLALQRKRKTLKPIGPSVYISAFPSLSLPQNFNLVYIFRNIKDRPLMHLINSTMLWPWPFNYFKVNLFCFARDNNSLTVVFVIEISSSIIEIQLFIMRKRYLNLKWDISVSNTDISISYK